MTRYILVFAVAFVASAISAFSQTPAEHPAQAPIHNAGTRFQKQHLRQTEEMLIKGLKSDDPEIQATSAQTIRDLEQMFPDEAFDALVIPMRRFLKNEANETKSRMLVAVALDALHSDDGDRAIAEIAQTSSDAALQQLCKALSIEAAPLAPAGLR